MRNLVVAIALVALFIEQASAFDFLRFDPLNGGNVERPKRQAEKNKCSWSAILKTFKCFEIPDGISGKDVQPCFNEVTRKMKIKKPSSNGVKTPSIPGMTFACTLACVLDKNNMLLSDGYANLTGLEEMFLEKSNDVWDPIVKSAFKTCSEEQKTLGASITEEGECKMPNLHFAFCLFQYAIENGPSKDTLKASEQTKCKNNIKTVSNCDPWKSLGEDPKVGTKVSEVLSKVGDKLKSVASGMGKGARQAFGKITENAKKLAERADKAAQVAKEGAKTALNKATGKLNQEGNNKEE